MTTQKILVGYKEQEEHFWSWAAGFWEGEGSAVFKEEYSVLRKKSFCRARMTISQNAREPLDYIVQQTGIGKVYFRKATKMRRVKTVFNDKGTYIWYCTRKREVIAFAELLLPHTRFRTKALSLFLEAVKKHEESVTWHSWSANEEAFIKANYATMPKVELVRSLSRSWKSIKQKAQKMKLRRCPN